MWFSPFIAVDRQSRGTLYIDVYADCVSQYMNDRDQG